MTEWRPLQRLTMGELFWSAVEKWGDNPLVSYRGHSYSYREIAGQVASLARQLSAEAGIGPGDRVAAMIANRPEFLVVDFAAASLGAVFVPLSTRFGDFELQSILQSGNIRALVAMNRFRDVDLLNKLASLTSPSNADSSAAAQPCRVFSLEPGGPAGVPVAELDSGGNGFEFEPEMAKPGDTAQIIYTSGTTSAPKGVRVRHNSIIPNACQIGSAYCLQSTDRLYVPIPLFTSYGSFNICTSTLIFGCCMVLHEEFDADEGLDLMRRERCTFFYGIGPIISQMVDAQRRCPRSLPTLRGGLGGIVPRDELIAWHELFGFALHVGYGMTETSTVICSTREGGPLQLCFDTEGRTFEGIEIRIVDPETRQSRPTGETGEISVRGYAVMEGYDNAPEENARVLDSEGWFYTGDLGSLDAEGHFHYRGRLKEMIKTGGFNVSAAEVEAVALQHPSVRLAYAAGIPDPQWGEVPVLFAVLKEGHSIGESQLIEFFAQRVAGYKKPRHVRFLPESAFPVSSTMKVQKFKLRKQLLAELGIGE